MSPNSMSAIFGSPPYIDLSAEVRRALTFSALAHQLILLDCSSL